MSKLWRTTFNTAPVILAKFFLVVQSAIAESPLPQSSPDSQSASADEALVPLRGSQKSKGQLSKGF